MQRRTFIRNTGLTLSAWMIAGQRSWAEILSDPAYKITMLSEKAGIFTEKGGTILFYLSDEGVVVVDSQFPDTAQHLMEELSKKTDKSFRLLINTHHHGDHSSGNIAFKNKVSHVLAHVNSKTNQEANAKKQNTEDKQLYPDQTYTDSWCEKIGNEKICLYYLGAAHTNGDSVVHFEKEGIVHMGDLVFNRRHPYVDRTTGANISNWMKVLETTAKKFSKKTTYVCGHAAEGYDVILKREDLLIFRDYLGNVLKFTADAIKAGKSKEEILTTTTIQGSPEWTGKGIERPLGAAYDELTAE